MPNRADTAGHTHTTPQDATSGSLDAPGHSRTATFHDTRQGTHTRQHDSRRATRTAHSLDARKPL